MFKRVSIDALELDVIAKRLWVPAHREHERMSVEGTMKLVKRRTIFVRETD
jgi:hypothetical protein